MSYSEYRVNADKTDVLVTILDGPLGPQEFNPDGEPLRGRNVTPALGKNAARAAALGYPYCKYGKLPYEWHSALQWATYVIYSYDTPIAWFDPDNGWTMPHMNLSVTTAKHQYKVRRALMGMISDGI